ncbi:MAG: MoaD/ThiS family protein [Bacteroidota bacterium]|nr:MoaD/ThiS family protein [Bacteroidota bacterium]
MEINITIQVFAVLKEYFEEKFEMNFPFQSSCTTILELLGKRHPQAMGLLSKCRVASEEAILDNDYTINHNDKIYIIPPSSGG